MENIMDPPLLIMCVKYGQELAGGWTNGMRVYARARVSKKKMFTVALCTPPFRLTCVCAPGTYAVNGTCLPFTVLFNLLL